MVSASNIFFNIEDPAGQFEITSGKNSYKNKIGKKCDIRLAVLFFNNKSSKLDFVFLASLLKICRIIFLVNQYIK